MRLLYYSTPSFAVCDFPLIKEYMEKGIDVLYLIKLTPYNCHSTLINIEKQIPINGIFKFSEYAESGIFSDYLDLDKIYVVNQLSPRNFSLSSLILTIKLILFIIRLKVNVLHTTIFCDLDSFLLFFKKKLVVTLHDPIPHTGEKSSRREIFRRLAIKYSSKIFLLNVIQKNKFIDMYHVDENKVEINRLGVYDSVNVYRNLIIDKVDASPSKNILFFGRISPYKGVEYLLEAMSIVHAQYPDAICTVMGGGEFYFDVTPYLNTSYVKIVNRFIATSELISAIESSFVVVCPYTDATQSGVVYTSYALHKPVIASDVGGFSESVIDSETGLLVPPRDSKSIADAIIYLLKHSDESVRMSNMIKKNISDGLFCWSNIADKYIDVYKNFGH